MEQLVKDIEACTICAEFLERGPRPVISVHPKSKILIIGQAPGTRVHETGIPWNDQSGKNLRLWMGIDDELFYDETQIGIVPMGFCYPGTGKSGDLPPPPRCAENWREKLLAALPNIQLTLVIGQYAMDWHLDEKPKTLTETVKQWRDYGPAILPLPHPSPRNNIWMAKNSWFGEDVLPELGRRVSAALTG